MTRLNRGAAGLGVVLAFALCASPARAQTGSTGKWEVEAHGGGMWTSSPSGGSAATLPAGTPFTTIAPGFSSLRVVSWLFGNGTTFLNQVNAALRSSARITALDGVLGSAAASREDGGSFGFRVARRFGSRYAAEFGFDVAQTPLRLTGAASTGIEATRGSFVTAFNGLLGTGPFTNVNVTATADVNRGSGHQILTTGVMTVDLLTHGRLIPFVAGGGGVISNGDSPGVTVLGNYAFSIVGVVPIHETDRVAVRVTENDHSTVGVFGGGIRYAASPRWGVRMDVRAIAGGGKTDTIVDATPSVVTGTPAGVIFSSTAPSIQFSSVPSVFTSLSGPAISSLRTFTGSGSAVRTNLTGGVYFRF